MKLTPQSRELILRRLSEIGPELLITEATLRHLPHRDPTLNAVVTRGAKLFNERIWLNRKIENDDAGSDG